jgi:predicted kinase
MQSLWRSTTAPARCQSGLVRPLLITGPPAAGKSATARALAGLLPLAAVIDVDDLRQLVVAGHAAPWDGESGLVQQRLGVENACDLARRFHGENIEVVIADVVTLETAALYRERLPAVMIVHLRISVAEARRRATQRPVHLTDEEFELLHAQQPVDARLYDHVIEVDRLDLAAQVGEVRRVWR